MKLYRQFIELSIINKIRVIVIIIMSFLLVWWIGFLLRSRLNSDECGIHLETATDIWFYTIQLFIFLPILYDTILRVKRKNKKVISFIVLFPTVTVLIIFAFFFYAIFIDNYFVKDICSGEDGTDLIKLSIFFFCGYFLLFPLLTSVLNWLERKYFRDI